MLACGEQRPRAGPRANRRSLKVAAFAVSAGSLWFPAWSPAQGPPVQELATAVAASDPAAVLAKVPPGQAVVAYRNGELMIEAHNAPLIDVLHTVCGKVGAVLEAPAVASERIFALLGPGRPREVLASLLNGSHLDYAMAGTAADPEGLGRLIVFAKTKTKGPRAENRRPQPRSGPATEPEDGSISSEAIGEAQAGAATPADTGDESQRADGSALYARPLGSGDSSPPPAAPLAQKAGAAGSDTAATGSETAGADPGNARPAPFRHRHRRR